MMTCLVCNHINRGAARFCRSCGVALTKSCSGCGAELEADSAFCDVCGTPGVASPAKSAGGASLPSRIPPRAYTPKHLAERILQYRSAIEGERKHVTVLFADVAGFTSMSERLDPEEVHSIMDRAFELILGEVHRYEGTINQFTGDGVMALFGAPVALEDAPLRAVQAALDIQLALGPLRHELLGRFGIEFWMRIGINTGMVVVGRIGNDLRMDYTAVGDTTNLAARLQSACVPGRVLVSEATHRLVRGFFEIREQPTFQAKGKSKPVRSFEVLARLSRQTSRFETRGEAGLTPLVGRGMEILSLESAFQAAVSGRGQLVLIGGEPGIGKTRLLHELRQRLQGRPHAWMEGRCVSYATTSVLMPIAEALRRHLGIEEHDDEASAVGKVERGLEAISAELAWTSPYVCHLLSLPSGQVQTDNLDPATLQSETFRALRMILDQFSRTNPLVLLIEDLHWIDGASEEFLNYFIEGLIPLPAVLICSYRPEYQPRFPAIPTTTLALQGLSSGEMARMSEEVLGTAGMSGMLRTLIQEKSEGNPLFIEEVIRSLLEQGLVQRKETQFVLMGDPHQLAVPDTILDVIAARIDRLPDAPKRTMQLASIIGREFALRLLQKLEDGRSPTMDFLEELRTLDLVYQKEIHPELAYIFKHALVHDVTYESILRQQRRILHGLVGRSIETLYGERLTEHYEVLAHHFTAAEDWPKALEYQERSAVKASAAYANKSVAERCRKALEICDRIGNSVTVERRRKLLEMLGHACFTSNDYQASAEAFERAAELTKEPSHQISALANAAFALTWDHKHERAGARLEKAFSLASTHTAPAAEGLLHTVHGYRNGVIHGDVNSYLKSSAHGITLGERAGDEPTVAMSRCFHAQALEWMGQYRRSIALNELAITVGRKEKLAQLVFIADWFIAKAACCLGDYNRAIQHLFEILSVTDRIGARAWKIRALNTLGWCFSELGAHDMARDYNWKAAHLADEAEDPEIIANSRINLALNFLDTKKIEDCQRELEPLRLGVEQNDVFMRWRYRLHLTNARARVALAQGRFDEVLSLSAHEDALARKHAAPKLQVRALLLQGQALLGQDFNERAVDAFTRARHLADSIEYHSGLWRSLGWEATARLRLGETENTQRLQARARTLLATTLSRLEGAELQSSLRREALSLKLLD